MNNTGNKSLGGGLLVLALVMFNCTLGETVADVEGVAGEDEA